jgi:hypothetical protein
MHYLQDLSRKMVLTSVEITANLITENGVLMGIKRARVI